MLGCQELIEAAHDDGRFLSLLSNLQYMIDHCDEPAENFKRYVFKSISTCNKLADEFRKEGGGKK